MAKQQQLPKSILNIFYRHGTKVGIGTLHEPAELKTLLGGAVFSKSPLEIQAVIEDEKIESETITIFMDDVIFYSIRVPRVITGLISEAPPGLSLDRTVQ